jgi:hypothetical protein
MVQQTSTSITNYARRYRLISFFAALDGVWRKSVTIALSTPIKYCREAVSFFGSHNFVSDFVKNKFGERYAMMVLSDSFLEDYQSLSSQIDTAL